MRSSGRIVVVCACVVADAGHGSFPRPRPGNAGRCGSRHVRRRAAWRDRRSLELSADRKDPQGRQRWDGPVPHHRFAARHVQPQLHPCRVQRGSASGRAGDGSGVIPINAEMRIGALQETVTVTGETPIVDTQSTRREMVIERRIAGHASRHAQLWNAAGRHSRDHDRQHLARCDDRTVHDVLHVERGSRQRGAHVDQWPSRRGVVQRRRRVHIHLRRGQHRRDAGPRVGGLGESEAGGPSVNLIPRSGGNAFNGTRVLQRHRRWPAVGQHRRLPAQHRPDTAAGAAQPIRCQWCAWRADRARPPVVLWLRSRLWQHHVH